MKFDVQNVEKKEKEKKLYNKTLHFTVDSELYNKIVEIMNDEQNVYKTRDLLLYSAIVEKLQRCLFGHDVRHNAGEIYLKQIKKLEG